MQEQSPVCRLDLYRQLNLPLPQVPSIVPTHQGGVRCKRAMGEHEGPLCRRDILKQMGLPIQEDAGTMNDMEAVVASMEEEVRAIQTELDIVHAERRQLQMQKRLLHCAAPAITSDSNEIGRQMPSSLPAKSLKTQIISSELVQENTKVSKPKLLITNPADEETELKNLEKQYNELLKEYSTKVEEVSSLRIEVETARRQSIASNKKSEQAESRVEDLETRLKSFEDESIKAENNREKFIELTNQLAMAERMFEKSFGEHEDLKKRIINKTMETDEFRKNYLDAEQNAEEQRYTIQMLEMERERFGETITEEIQKVKKQFQSKLEELTMLPELIKKTNVKLKESEEIKTITEKNCVIISMNLDDANEEKNKLQKLLDEVKKNKSEAEAEKSSMKSFLSDEEKKVEEAQTENKDLKVKVSRFEEMAVINGRKYEEAIQEGKLLYQQLETLRQQSARQVSKTKERFEKTRQTLMDQIAILEKQLASTRAIERTALRDRDEIRQKMQAQIIQLNENFEQAQQRIRSIQSHVNYLKMSYCNSLESYDIRND